MNIFLLPSWYPTANNPISGIFTKEQSMMIAQMNPKEVNYFVSNISLHTISPKKIWQSIKNLNNFKKSKLEIISLANNYSEYSSSTLSWSHYIFNGNFNALVEKHRENLRIMLNDENKIDIIHAHVSYPAGYIAYLLSNEFNIPYIITEHMGPFPFKQYLDNGKPIKQIEKAINNAKRVIAVSHSLKREISDFNLKEPLVINNFIDNNKYNIKKTQKDKFIFLSVGSLSYQKGTDILIKAIEKMPNLVNIEFRIVGSDKNKAEYVELVKKYNLSRKVNFLGILDRAEVAREFENCDVFVLPSRHESFGVVYIEALACGKPIIATLCGGPEDIVNSNNGIIVEVEDPIALSNAMQDVYENYKKYDKSLIRNDFLKRFSKEVNTTKYLELYREILKCVE